MLWSSPDKVPASQTGCGENRWTPSNGHCAVPAFHDSASGATLGITMSATVRSRLRLARTAFAAAILAACAPVATSEIKVAARPTPSGARCASNGVVVQVLGSGGPIPDDARASSGTLVWVEGRSRVLIDAGGGVFQRFGAAGARLEDLDLIALTHMHTDHVSDVPALLKGGYFSDRNRVLAVSGPTGSALFPSVSEYLRLQFGASSGTFRYLSWLLKPAGERFSLAIHELDAESRSEVRVLNAEDLTVDAMGVHHGPVPTLAYRVTVGARRIVVGADGSGRDEAFVRFAQGADVLVLPHAIPEGAGDAARELHTRPSEIAEAAVRIRPRRLVLNHHMHRSLQHLEKTLEEVRKLWGGSVVVADDLDCITLD